MENSTGEIYETETVTTVKGSVYYTPEQQRARREWKLATEKRKLTRSALSPLGNFYFVLSGERFDGISPASVTRLLFLNTYLRYESNRLMLTERTPMQKADIQGLLHISAATFSRFWKEVSPEYIEEDENGVVFSNRDVFIRGSLPKNKFTECQKLYIKAVRSLYLTVNKKQYKQLGYIFKLLPFINLEYNILCAPESIYDSDINNIRPLSVAEFCEQINYDATHFERLLKIYRSITFDVGDRKERFCALISDGIDKQNANICINPHILYNGSDYRKVEVLGAFYASV